MSTEEYQASKREDIADIGMMQLSDSFFPSGMYTTSSGLEAIFYSQRRKMKRARAVMG